MGHGGPKHRGTACGTNPRLEQKKKLTLLGGIGKPVRKTKPVIGKKKGKKKTEQR